MAAQLEVQERVSTLADLDEQVAELHKRLEKQLLQQLDTQEALRCSCLAAKIAGHFCAGSPMACDERVLTVLACKAACNVLRVTGVLQDWAMTRGV